MAVQTLTNPTLIVPSAAAGVSGSADTWVELIASAAADLVAQSITILPVSAGRYTVQIGVGAASSEVAIAYAASFIPGNLYSGNTVIRFPIPIDNIPAGSRVSIRCSKNFTMGSLAYWEKPLSAAVTVTAQPCLIADPFITITPSSSDWGNSSWVEFIASTSAPIAIGALGVGAGAVCQDGFEIDIGVGGAGSEVVVGTIRGTRDDTSLGGGLGQYDIHPLIGGIGGGQRISLRLRKAGTSTSNWFVSPHYYLNPPTDGQIITEGLYLTAPPAADSPAVTTHPSTSWEWGSWVEIIASIGQDSLITGVVASTGSSIAIGLIDIQIGVGAASSEVPIAAVRVHLPSSVTGSRRQIPLWLPVAVPSGSRVAVRIRGFFTNNSNQIALQYIDDQEVAQRTNLPIVEAFDGAPAGGSTPGCSAGWGSGAWEQMLPASEDGYTLLGMSDTFDGSEPYEYEYDVGIDNGGGEQVLTTMRNGQNHVLGACTRWFPFTYPMPVPPGYAVTFRCRSSASDGATNVGLIYIGGAIVPLAPTAETDPVTDITRKTATLNGTFTGNGTDIDGFFRWGPSNPPTEFDTSPQAVGDGETPVALEQAIDGLTPGATYYVRAIAISVGSPGVETEGEVVAFTTLSDPEVVTSAVTGIGLNGATLNGSVDPNGTDVVGFFRWGPETPPTSFETTPESIGDGLSPVAIDEILAGLTPGVTYWVQAVAQTTDSPAEEFVGAILSWVALALGETDEVLEGQPGILVWMNWHRFDPTGGSPALEEAANHYSDQDLHCPGSYFGGFKEARIQRFGPIERAFSDQRTGDWKGSSCQILISDYDRSIRTRAGSATQKFWTSSVVAVRMVSRATRAVLGQPLTCFVGPIRKANPEGPLSYRLELQDQVGQFLTSQLRVPQRLVDAGFVGFDLVEEALSHPEPIIYGQHSRTEGAYKPIYLGVDGATHVWLVAGHACKAIDDIFIDGASVLGDVGSVWTLETSTDLGGRRYCLVRGTTGSTNPDNAADGTAVLTINVSGVESIGDGTGALIIDGLLQYQHFAINYLSSREGYQTGPWPATPPTWTLLDFIVPAVDVGSFQAASVLAQTRYGAGGYVSRVIIGHVRSEQRLARDWIARWNLALDVRFGVKRYGQMFVRMTQPTTADYLTAPVFTDALDIIKGTFREDTRWEEQFNRIPYAADYDFALGTFLAVGRDGEDNQAIADYGQDIVSPVREYWMVPDSDQGKNVAEYEVLRTAHPPRIVQFETAVGRAANLELGDYIRVRHFATVPPSADRLYQLEEHVITPGKRRVRIRAVDVHDLIDVVVAT